MRNVFLVVLPAFIACGGNDTITCEVLSDQVPEEPNCWADALDAIDRCTAGLGTFNADRTSCEYDSGESLTFSSSLDTTPFVERAEGTGPEFDAVLRDSAGDVCAQVTSAPGRVSVDVDGEQTILEWNAESTVAGSTVSINAQVLTCPDGRVYDVESIELTECNTRRPAVAWIAAADVFAFTLLGRAPEEAGANLFNCVEGS